MAPAAARSFWAPQTCVNSIPRPSVYPLSVLLAHRPVLSPVVTPEALAFGVAVPQHISAALHLALAEHVDPAAPAAGSLALIQAAVRVAFVLASASTCN